VHPKASYFTRGSGHTQYGGYTEDSTEYQMVLRPAESASSAPRADDAARDHRAAWPFEVGVVAIGSSDGAVREALDILKARGVGVNYMRIRAFPFGREVSDFFDKHEIVFVVEQNRDAQLRSLLTLETPVEKTKLRSIPALQRVCRSRPNAS